MLTSDDFRAAPEFADQPEEHLAWLAGVAHEWAGTDGDKPFERNDAATHMGVVAEGSIQIFTWRGAQRVLFGTVPEGGITGLLPFSRMERFGGEGIAVGPTRVALVPKARFWEMMERMPEVGQRLVARMTDRVRESSRGEQQREKMVALGKLSAGLAHELNNPAAAVRRAAAELRTRFSALPGIVTRLTGHGLTPAQVEAARAELMTCTANLPGTLSPVRRGELEDALADWLDDHGVPHAYQLAETLADEGVTPESLQRLAGHVPSEALADTILWIEKGLASERLLGEVEAAAGRISELVASVKAYSHMDRAPDRQPASLHAGLDQTLTMLGHAVKTKSVAVERAYVEGLPDVMVYPGEINQVWTNLLDNAIDAVPEGGTVRIETFREGALACVVIQDDGPGIPEGAVARIWEPFFSTKEPGAGTGLGLDIARRIVEQHEGRIDVESAPGRTRFTVCLPIGD